MSLHFFDTSALVKRYHLEKGSETVNSIVDNPDNALVISSLSIAEFVSTFTRKLHEGGITGDDIHACLSEFSKDIMSSFLIVDLERRHINKGVALILKHNIRTLDSLQLAVFLNLSNISPNMVTSDKALAEAAQKEGFSVIMP